MSISVNLNLRLNAQRHEAGTFRNIKYEIRKLTFNQFRNVSAAGEYTAMSRLSYMRNLLTNSSFKPDSKVRKRHPTFHCYVPMLTAMFQK